MERTSELQNVPLIDGLDQVFSNDWSSSFDATYPEWISRFDFFALMAVWFFFLFVHCSPLGVSSPGTLAGVNRIDDVVMDRDHPWASVLSAASASAASAAAAAASAAAAAAAGDSADSWVIQSSAASGNGRNPRHVATAELVAIESLTRAASRGTIIGRRPRTPGQRRRRRRRRRPAASAMAARTSGRSSSGRSATDRVVVSGPTGAQLAKKGTPAAATMAARCQPPSSLVRPPLNGVDLPGPHLDSILSLRRHKKKRLVTVELA